MTIKATEIRSGPLEAALAPALGGVVLSLSCGGRDILRRAHSTEAVAEDPREAACYPMVPWFSRLPGGLVFGGRRYDLAPTLPACDPDHALHGHGWVRAWTVAEQSQDRLVCSFEHEPAPRLFPFPFIATQEFSVAPDSFEIVLTVANSGDAPMPAGLGLHPFFPEKKTSAFNVTEYFRQPAAPSALRSPDKMDHRGPFPDDPVDYTIRAWDGAAEIVRDAMRLALTSNAPHLHLYSPEDSDFYCAEPVTHLPGDFGRALLASGEKMQVFMKIFVAAPSAK